jgi:hypothetical protein
VQNDKAIFSRFLLSGAVVLINIITLFNFRERERKEKKLGKKFDSPTVNVVAIIRTITFYATHTHIHA